jgi:hypothetical protein
MIQTLVAGEKNGLLLIFMHGVHDRLVDQRPHFTSLWSHKPTMQQLPLIPP